MGNFESVYQPQKVVLPEVPPNSDGVTLFFYNIGKDTDEDQMKKVLLNQVKLASSFKIRRNQTSSCQSCDVKFYQGNRLLFLSFCDLYNSFKSLSLSAEALPYWLYFQSFSSLIVLPRFLPTWIFFSVKSCFFIQ